MSLLKQNDFDHLDFLLHRGHNSADYSEKKKTYSFDAAHFQMITTH